MKPIRGEYLGVPGFFWNDPTSPDKLRFVATKHGWRKLREVKAREAGERCQVNRSPNCRTWATLEHGGELHHTGKHGRGAGGAFRDDRETVWSCAPCHRLEERKRQGTRWANERAASPAPSQE